ncbi:diphthamide biosynthesis protein [Chiua virens]|nr:diphthamide biosynthesis protein [Chiua virens]
MSAELPPSSAFAASGENAIARSIDITSSLSAQRPEASNLAGFYEVERTAEIILKGEYKRVALQFPDELLNDAVPVYRLLKQSIGREHELYVLADTSYGNCCVDEVAAQHVDADLMVHYGHACMSKTSRLPVVYVFGRKQIDVDDCVQELAKILQNTPESDDAATKSVLVRHDVGYAHRVDDIVQRLRDKSFSVLYHEIPTWVEPATAPSLSASGYYPIHRRRKSHSHQPVDDPFLKSGLLVQSNHEIFKTRSRKRAMQMSLASLWERLVSSYLPVISHLRKILTKAQKKSYTISVGKLNPAKLANFMEIECFVLAACPENSVIESKEFYRPIITPYELEVALQAEGTWSGRYVLDFGRLLAEFDFDDDLSKQEEGPRSGPTYILARYRKIPSRQAVRCFRTM